jgi:hypothetical protein
MKRENLALALLLGMVVRATFTPRENSAAGAEAEGSTTCEAPRLLSQRIASAKVLLLEIVRRTAPFNRLGIAR